VNPSRVFLAALQRDLLVGFRRWTDVTSPLLFFVLVITLYPLALSPKPEVLKIIGPAVLWIAALLATLMSLNAMFRADLDDGTLEQLLVLPEPLALPMLAKIIAHWLFSGLPLVLLAPVVGITYHLPAEATAALALTLLLGTPVLSLVGAIGAALTAGLRQAGALLALLVTPLMLPVLIMGSRATDLAAQGQEITGILYLLAALLALALTLAPLAVAAAIRISLD
jgi:heme exporter protein B